MTEVKIIIRKKPTNFAVVEKNGVIYDVRDTCYMWKVKSRDVCPQLELQISKKYIPTAEALMAHIAKQGYIEKEAE